MTFSNRILALAVLTGNVLWWFCKNPYAVIICIGTFKNQFSTVLYLPLVYLAMWGSKGLALQWLSLKYLKPLKEEVEAKSYTALTVPKEVLSK